MVSYLVGLDVGTTASKAVVCTSEGREVASGKARTVWTVTDAGVETSPEELWQSAMAAVAAATTDLPAGRVRGIGVASMGECGVLLDVRDQAIGPVVAWHDGRDAAETARLRKDFEADAFADLTGLATTGQWSLTKHRWLMADRPELAVASSRLSIAEWVAFRLGGRPVAELSLASRTGWLGLRTKRWLDETLAWSGAAATLLPDEIVTGGMAIGEVAGPAVPRTVRGATITVAGHDHQVALVGAGAYGRGAMLDSFGSAEALLRPSEANLEPEAVRRLASKGIATGWSPLPDMWTVQGGTRGGLVLQTLVASLGLPPGDLRGPSQQSSPHVRVVVDESDNVGIEGLSPSTSAEEIWRAGVDYTTGAAAEVYRALCQATGVPHTVTLIGGWTRHESIVSARRELYGSLRIPEISEPGAYGAAMLAGVAAGVFDGVNALPSVRLKDAPPSKTASAGHAEQKGNHVE